MNTLDSVLVDANVFIDLLRAGKDPAQTLLRRFDTTDLVTCGVVKSEVLRGVRSPVVRDKLAAFFNIMCFVDMPLSAWDETWQLAWRLDREGRVLPLTDLCIATCALRAEAAIVTNDRHFDHIPGLVVLPMD
ncbi:type II toxin-antitoxin system VapC family toxin [Sulfuriroseicoccus oceanibius]|uniref:Ribonuclease VapC n=1 Tax=Sulfuriroseicoccus oceanibius TaxID=2707525 RepID=A0A6B3LA11_9BACT|nr:PIN domain-containing protein [Sulfuriroseicoccus oceanibius]QQL44736.1 PIN domain-containing protein [Sulfuriroseicoccus oceanibius]